MTTIAQGAIELTVQRLLAHAQRQQEGLDRAARLKRSEIRVAYLATIRAMEDQAQFEQAYVAFIQQFGESEWQKETALALRRARTA